MKEIPQIKLDYEKTTKEQYNTISSLFGKIDYLAPRLFTSLFDEQGLILTHPTLIESYIQERVNEELNKIEKMKRKKDYTKTKPYVSFNEKFKS